MSPSVDDLMQLEKPISQPVLTLIKRDQSGPPLNPLCLAQFIFYKRPRHRATVCQMENFHYASFAYNKRLVVTGCIVTNNSLYLLGIIKGNTSCYLSMIKKIVFSKVQAYCATASHRCDGLVVGASASQSVDLGFNPLAESYQKILKDSIHSFPTWRSA